MEPYAGFFIAAWQLGANNQGQFQIAFMIRTVHFSVV
jgi:hypothetical protein